MEAEEKALLARAKSGDADAVSALVERYAPQVLRFATKMCGHGEDARDVLQESLIDAARGLADFRGDSSLGSWLYSIARSRCIKHRRKRTGEPASFASLDEVREDLAAGNRPDEEADARQLGERLERAIEALDPIYREVLLLRDVEGLTAPEVAEAIGLGVDAVKSRLHRARAQVRKHLSSEEPPLPGCPDVIELFSRHLEGELDASMCQEMESHVAGCARCSADCDSLKEVLSLCQTAAVPDVPSDVRSAVRREIRALMDARLKE